MEKKITFQCPKCGETLSFEARLVSNHDSQSADTAARSAGSGSATSVSCSCGESVVADGIVIATGRGGKFRPSEFRSAKASQRLAALKAAGIDVSHFFVATGASGDQKLARTSENGLEFVSDDDAVFLAIIADERELSDPRLFRRWVLAQMFDAISYHGYDDASGFTPWLKRKGYEYSFSTMRHELNVQAAIYVKDPENFAIRNAWMNKDVAISMIDLDIRFIQEYVDCLRPRHCKHKEYKRIKRVGDVFVTDLGEKVFRPLEFCRAAVKNARNPSALAKAFAKYCEQRIPNPLQRAEMCPEWIDAYKGVGAYYSLENLIKYHGCFFWSDTSDRRRGHCTKSTSLDMLLDYNRTYSASRHGYKFLGLLKQFIADNRIDIAAKRREWSARK